MKIVLKEDWDIPIHPPVHGSKRKGHFVGRAKELSLLANELFRRDSGAILVTGYRGVGKTSLVYEAISRVCAQDTNVVPVFISASQLHDENPLDPAGKAIAQNPKRLIIESIIRRLYATTRDDERIAKFQRAIEDLYRKAVAANFELTTQAAQEDARIEQFTRQSVTQINFNQIATFVLCATIALLLLFVPGWSDNPFIKVVSLLIAVPGALGINYLRNVKKDTTSKFLSSAQAKEVYSFDGSIGNLEFDLEKLHRDLSREQIKLIYVIDELDKLVPKAVGELLKFFKNLFTLSEALFIFIADEEIYGYNWAGGAAAKSRRPVEYTYFTSRYFLSRPLYEDLREFLSSIIERADIPAGELDRFCRAICFAAENDFFDLRSALTDRITSFDEKKPVVEFPSFSTRDEQSSRFHTVFTSLFERKYMAASRSKWQENERLQNALFQHLAPIEKAFAGYGFADPHGEDIDSQLIRDCNAVLTRVGALKSDRNPETKNLRGIDVLMYVYKYVGSIPEDPPETLTEPSEFERRYIAEVASYYEYARAILNAFRETDHQPDISEVTFHENPKVYLQGQEWDYDFLGPVNNHAELYQGLLTERPLPVVERSEIEKRTTEISNARQSVLLNALPGVIAGMLIQLHPAGQLEQNRLTESSQLFSAADPIRSILQPRTPICVYTSDFKHQVAVVSGESEKIRRSAEWLKPFQKTHRIIVIGDFGNTTRSYTYGVYFVDTNTAQSLKTSLTRVLKSTTAFWTRESDEE
jgi:Cdc6-like AAA superfamily ATPase